MSCQAMPYDIKSSGSAFKRVGPQPEKFCASATLGSFSASPHSVMSYILLPSYVLSIGGNLWQLVPLPPVCASRSRKYPMDMLLTHRSCVVAIIPGHDHVSSGHVVGVEERRPVAMRNAALSVRNLKRSLRILESLGVDPKLGASAAVMDQVRGCRLDRLVSATKCARCVAFIGDAW